MSSDLTKRVDAVRLAGRGGIVEGSVPIAACGRLVLSLNDHRGEATGLIRFALDPEGRILLEGECQAQVELICQRCLEPISLALGGRFLLQLMQDGGPVLREDCEPLEADADGTLLPCEVIEDELILSLPLAPMHEGLGCEPAAPLEEVGDRKGEQAGTHRPFSVLAGLKRRDD